MFSAYTIGQTVAIPVSLDTETNGGTQTSDPVTITREFTLTGIIREYSDVRTFTENDYGDRISAPR